MKTLDARGLSCPEPVIMIRKAMASKENVTRYAEHQGYKVTVTEKNEEFVLVMCK